MTDTASAASAATRPPPFFKAPLLVVLLGAGLAVLHAAYSFAPVSTQLSILYDFALAPERFWAPAGSPKVYPDAASGLLTLVSSALLHTDWLHVMVNSLMLIALGTPVLQALGRGLGGTAAWLLLLLVSVIAGSALYLALADVNAPYLIGASGGTSGLFAAVFLLDRQGRRLPLWSRQFLAMTGAFALVNVLLVLTGPMLFGAYVSWEAHAGGYVAGALMMSILPLRAPPAPDHVGM